MADAVADVCEIPLRLPEVGRGVVGIETGAVVAERRHEALRRYCRELNRIYVSEEAMYRCDSSWDGFKWLNVNDRDRSTIAFLRTYPGAQEGLVCVCNFTPNRYDGFVIGLPKTGTLREILNSDDERFGGGGVCNKGAIRSHHRPFLDLEHSAEITVPAMSCIYFRYKIRKEHK